MVSFSQHYSSLSENKSTDWINRAVSQTTVTEMFWDPYKAILAYRNTTIDMLGMSSTPLFFGRRLKTDLPADTSPLQVSTNVGMQDNKKRLITRKYQQKLNFDAHAGKEFSRSLFCGNFCNASQNKWTPTIVMQKQSATIQCAWKTAGETLPT